MSHKRHFLEYDTERGTQVELKTWGRWGRICGVEYKRRAQQRERTPEVCMASPGVLGWPLSCGCVGRDSTTTRGCKMNDVHYTWLGDTRVLTGECGRNSLNTYQGPFSGNLGKIAAYEYGQIALGCFVHIKSPHFRLFCRLHLGVPQPWMVVPLGF